MKHGYCFKQESCFHFVNPGTAMITTVSGVLLVASRYITTTRHCVIKTNRGWKNHGLLHCNHQVLISYPYYATIKSYIIGHSSLTAFCLRKFTPYFRWYFYGNMGFVLGWFGTELVTYHQLNQWLPSSLVTKPLFVANTKNSQWECAIKLVIHKYMRNLGCWLIITKPLSEPVLTYLKLDQ